MPESCRSRFVKSFGRRLAYESLRRTNPRSQGEVYGDLMIRLWWVGQFRRFPGCPGSACRKACRAIGAQIQGRGCVTWVMELEIGRPNGATEPMGTRGVDDRSLTTTARRRHEPCRVTASSSRLVREKPGAPAVGSRDGRSRGWSCDRRSTDRAVVDRLARPVQRDQLSAAPRAVVGRGRHWPCGWRWRVSHSCSGAQ